MDPQIKNLRGAPKHDTFKFWHKQLPLGGNLYACDIDLVLVDFRKKRIAAFLEYKPDNILTDSEMIIFNHLESIGLPVFILHCATIGHDLIDIIKYVPGNGPNIFNHGPITSGLSDRDYVDWERKIRGYPPLDEVIREL